MPKEGRKHQKAIVDESLGNSTVLGSPITSSIQSRSTLFKKNIPPPPPPPPPSLLLCGVLNPKRKGSRLRSTFNHS
ncbi:hypothetical protein K435DRAFT_872460 [Dendrothele bispora CBS 962.96]|uniref:Uncharacterized protein n=1 Tax=Dendrothele bispora (strain CBS 962.96) TaxID=1314807 RepID=A0A4S8L1I5_DENBC|nr:hypothetical protein K435DRAFT_872460 [Dendrothele bispora CBS 962.96]